MIGVILLCISTASIASMSTKIIWTSTPAFASGPNIFDDFVVAPTSVYARQLVKRIAEHTSTLAERCATCGGQCRGSAAASAHCCNRCRACPGASGSERKGGRTGAEASKPKMSRSSNTIFTLRLSMPRMRRNAKRLWQWWQRSNVLVPPRRSLARVRDELDLARGQVAALHGSTSRRATAAMRSAVRGARKIMEVPKTGVRLVMERGLAWLKQRPQMARFALRAAELPHRSNGGCWRLQRPRRLGVVASPTWTLVPDPQSVQEWRELLAQKR